MSADFSFASAVEHLSSARLQRAAARYDTTIQGIVNSTASSSPPISISVVSADEGVSLRTDYAYNVTVVNTGITITASSIYGAMYAMESITQLLSEDNATLPTVVLEDAPQYPWRGLLIDSGKRFAPMPLIYSLLDTMSYMKMNVLHLHATDVCRFGVESKIYPNLTDVLTGLQAGHYSQEDVKDMVVYAADRGIRVVPEFDVPGHSRGFVPIINEGIEFCTDNVTNRNQLYNDAQNSTLNVLKKLFAEMSALFPDDVFNIGCDETRATGRCTQQDTYSIERELQSYITTDLKKTPSGWEELLTADATTPSTIVSTWDRRHPIDVTKKGLYAIESAEKHFYYTQSAASGANGWAPSWYNISTDLPYNQTHLLLGGEVSMWTDTYLYIAGCTKPFDSPPHGAPLYNPVYDKEYAQSIGGMMWPRGFVGAGSFWNYDATQNATSEGFIARIEALNNQMAARGVATCPNNCSCNQMSACGKSYLPKMDVMEENTM